MIAICRLTKDLLGDFVSSSSLPGAWPSPPWGPSPLLFGYPSLREDYHSPVAGHREVFEAQLDLSKGFGVPFSIGARSRQTTWEIETWRYMFVKEPGLYKPGSSLCLLTFRLAFSRLLWVTWSWLICDNNDVDWLWRVEFSTLILTKSSLSFLTFASYNSI